LTSQYNPVPENKFAGLDHLRAFAILLVFCFHYPATEIPEWLADIKDFGWTGVDLFFVLSGFLIARQLFQQIKNKNWIGPFFIKRILRIFPVYFFVVAIYFIFPGFREKEALASLWKFLTFTQNIGLDPGINGTFSHAWSLCVEEQFYLFFPLILLLLIYLKIEKKGFYIILFFFVFTCLFRLFLWYNYIDPLIKTDGNYSKFWITWIYYPTYTRLDGLLVGISIAGIYIFLPKTKLLLAKYGNLLLVLGTGILMSAYFICMPQVGFNANIFGFPIVAIGYGFLVAAAISPACILYKFKSPVTASIATLSYSVYLIHKAIRHLCHNHLSNYWGIEKQSVLMFFICLAAAFLGALLLRYTIEKPCLKLRDYLLEKYYAWDNSFTKSLTK
jgi:peptidoglycan/LPS O-acetylase OafA/YrhL